MKKMIQILVIISALTAVGCSHWGKGGMGGQGNSCACGDSKDGQKSECELKGDCKDGCKCGK